MRKTLSSSTIFLVLSKKLQNSPQKMGTAPLSAVFVWRFKFTNGQLDRKTFEVDNWASLELPTRQ